MTESGEKRGPLQKRWLVLAAVVVLALIFLIPFIREGGARVDTSVEVETETAFVGDIRETAQGSAVIKAAQSSPVQAQYSGRIASVAVEEGDLVEPGDLLATYDTEELEEQIVQLVDELDQLDTQIAEEDRAGSFDIVAETDSLVKAVYAQRGDVAASVVETSGSLMLLSTDGLLRTKLSLEAGNELAVGDAVWVDIGDAREEGAVLEADEETGVVTVTFADRPEYPLEAETVVTGLDGTELGRGTAAANRPCLIQADACIISRVEAEAGSYVAAGDPLFHCIDTTYGVEYMALLEQRVKLVNELLELQAFQENPVLLAEERGVVSDLSVQPGDSVAEEDQLCSLTATDAFTVRVEILARDIEQVQPGQQVELVFDRYPDQTYLGQVERRSAKSETVGALTVYPVTVSLEGAEGLETGLSGQATIILDSESDALLVPAVAVQTQEDGSQVVEIRYGDGLTRVSRVETGLCNDEYVQILRGVEEGDQVVVASKMVETKVFSFFRFEWVIGQEEEPLEPASEAASASGETAE